MLMFLHVLLYQPQVCIRRHAAQLLLAGNEGRSIFSVQSQISALHPSRLKLDR
jgi:hypothetical protein